MEDFLNNQIFDVLDIEKKSVIFVKPTDKQFGDYVTNIALQMAKTLHISPHDYYLSIKEKLESIEFVESVDFLNGFINIKIDTNALAENILNNNFEFDNVLNNDKLAIVEYPSPNMAKPFSVGHLRSANQGWAARNVLRKVGWKVITDNHIGDYGTPFGIWAEGYELLSNEEKLKEGGVYELGRIYIEMRKRMKEESMEGKNDLASGIQDWLTRLSNDDKKAVGYHDMFYAISLEHMHNIMDRLNITTDYEYGESFYVDLGQKLVDEYIERGIAKLNEDGSVVASLEKYNIKTPILLRKSNGLPLYATTDVATMVFRKNEFKPDLVVYAVGNEQKFHFEQLFAFANEIDVPYQKVHLSYGMVEDIDIESGKRQKISSRKGTILLEELLDKAEEKVSEMTNNKEIGRNNIAKIALGAIKFRDFSQDRNSNYLFEWDKMFALTGFSGPSIQYAAVRIKKIIRDSDIEFDENLFVNGYDYSSEKDLLIKIGSYKHLIDKISQDFKFHNLAIFLYDISKLVNVYYEQVPILKGDVNEKNKRARVGFLKKVFDVLADGLGVLGIEIPDCM